MSKHKHCDMIVAKAANMELVVFGNQIGSEWRECTFADLVIDTGFYEYFLCLPQHKEACLHWLNGGDVQQKPINESQWVTSADANKVTWKVWTSFMKDDLEFRIKPRKEKRWFVYSQEYDCMASTLMKSPPENMNEGHQLIKIEVDV